MLRVSLETSEAVAAAENARRPRRGGIVFGYVQMILLYLFMEVNRCKFATAVTKVTDEELAAMGFPVADGKVRRPSVGTLNGFVVHALPSFVLDISNNIAAAWLSAKEGARVITVDSTPLDASPYNRDCDYSPHYERRMDKAHIIMADGFPLAMEWTSGNTADSPMFPVLVDRVNRLGAGVREEDALMADGAYSGFSNFSCAYMKTGIVLNTNLAVNAVAHPEATWPKVQAAYSQLRREEGFDPNRKNDRDFVLRFLVRHGRDTLVGMYLRNMFHLEHIRMRIAGVRDTRRTVCETVHHSMKSWIRMNVIRLTHKTRGDRVACKFLCVQLLSMLFKGYRVPDAPKVRGSGASKRNATHSADAPDVFPSTAGFK